MHVLFVSPNLVPMPPLFGGAIEEHVWQLANALASRGLRVSVVGDVLEKYNSSNIASHRPGSYNIFPAEFPKVIPLHLLQGFRNYKTYSKLDLSGFDVVSLHEEVSSFLILRKKKRKEVIYTYTFHNPFTPLSSNPSAENIFRNLSFQASRIHIFRKVDLVLVPSRHYLHLLKREYKIPNAVYFPQVVDVGVGGCCSSEAGELLDRLGLERRGYAIFVGRLNLRKGAHLLPLLRDIIPLVVVGDGPLRETLGRFKEIKLLGRVSRGDMIKLLGNALVSLNLSQLDIVSYTLLESMACGVPVIASNIPAFREVVKDGENSYLVDIRKPAELRAVVKAILEREDLEEVGMRAREYVAKHHSPSVCASIFLQHLSQLRPSYTRHC